MDALFDDLETLERTDPVARVIRSDSTAEARERSAFLKRKKKDEVWEENGRWYCQGSCGATVFNPEKWGR